MRNKFLSLFTLVAVLCLPCAMVKADDNTSATHPLPVIDFKHTS
jgi:hypothetical protein